MLDFDRLKKSHQTCSIQKIEIQKFGQPILESLIEEKYFYGSLVSLE